MSVAGKKHVTQPNNFFFCFQVYTADVMVAVYTTQFFIYSDVSEELITSVFRAAELVYVAAEFIGRNKIWRIYRDS